MVRSARDFTCTKPARDSVLQKSCALPSLHLQREHRAPARRVEEIHARRSSSGSRARCRAPPSPRRPALERQRVARPVAAPSARGPGTVSSTRERARPPPGPASPSGRRRSTRGRPSPETSRAVYTAIAPAAIHPSRRTIPTREVVAIRPRPAVGSAGKSLSRQRRKAPPRSSAITRPPDGRVEDLQRPSATGSVP